MEGSCEFCFTTGTVCYLADNHKLHVLNENEVKILKLRTGIDANTICSREKNKQLSFYASHQLHCCDPMSKHPGKKLTKDLREITLETAERYQAFNLIPGKKWCSSCRKNIHSYKPPEPSTLLIQDITDAPGSGDDDNDAGDESFESTSAEISIVNESLCAMGESPVQMKMLASRKRYREDKAKSIANAYRRKMSLPSQNNEEEIRKKELERYKKYYKEMIGQLKDKFQSSDKRSDKLQILTVLPSSFTLLQIQDEFNVSNYTARAAKKLVKEKGVLATPNPKSGNKIPKATKESVKLFYQSDEISRNMPGKKDCVSMLVDGKRSTVQKRLILCNLKEAYQLFKSQNNIKLGFSKFASLRPKNVVLPGASGTHSVCVCTIHQNVTLMLEGSKISSCAEFCRVVGEDYNGPIRHGHLIETFLCNPAQPICFFGDCNYCGDTSFLKTFLEETFESLDVDEITYKAWVTVDRTSLETITKSTEDFIVTLIENLQQLKRHGFIARMQAAYYRDAKEELKLGEVLVVCDFAENYSFVLQDAAQSFHWNNMQATLHPFVIYHRFPVEEDTTTNLKCISLVIISDCLSHNTTAFHCFQRKLVKFLKNRFQITKAYYFTDGAASQYKNRKNFLNLAFHENDFGLVAEWNFFATSHGKGPCDGVGGTVKRLAARASLQRPYDDQIQTPLQLFEWAHSSLKEINFAFVSQDEYDTEERLLSARSEKSKTVPGTHQFHSFSPIPNSRTLLAARHYSLCESQTIVKVSFEEEGDILAWHDLNGFVTCVYDNKWWLALILQADKDDGEVKVKFLQPSGPSPSFCYPTKEDILLIPKSSILTKVEPRTHTGRTYFLTKEESLKATQILTDMQL